MRFWIDIEASDCYKVSFIDNDDYVAKVYKMEGFLKVDLQCHWLLTTKSLSKSVYYPFVLSEAFFGELMDFCNQIT